MKVLNALGLVAALVLATAAQENTAINNSEAQLKARNAPDAFVLSVSAHGPDRKGKANFTIEVHNTGEKTIAALDWEYMPPETGHEYDVGKVKRFRSEARVRPGEKKKFNQSLDHTRNEMITGFKLNNVRIVKVEYGDGSVWQRPADAKPK